MSSLPTNMRDLSLNSVGKLLLLLLQTQAEDVTFVLLVFFSFLSFCSGSSSSPSYNLSSGLPLDSFDSNGVSLDGTGQVIGVGDTGLFVHIAFSLTRTVMC